jgi:hypothetical protein
VSYAQAETVRRVSRFSPAALLLVLLITWTTAAYILIRENVLRLRFVWDRQFLDWTINPIVASVGRDRLLLPVVILGKYTMLLVAPWRLSLDYGGGVMSPTADPQDPYLVLGLFAAIAWLIAFAVALLRRNKLVLFCLFGLGMFYGLVGNIVTIIGTNVGERLMYVPSAFFCILVALGISKFRPRVQVVTMSILLILASARTLSYAWQWNHPETLFRATLKHSPRSVRVHLLLAEELQRPRRLAEADAVMAEAREQFPGYWKVWEESVAIALDADDVAAAHRFYERGVAASPMMQLSSVGKQLAARRAAAATRSTTTRGAPATGSLVPK